ISMDQDKIKEASLKQTDYENELRNYIVRKTIDTQKLNLLVEQIDNKILKFSENNIANLVSAYSVEKTDFEMLLQSIMMNYDLQNDYYVNMTSLYKNLIDLESLTGQRLYSI